MPMLWLPLLIAAQTYAQSTSLYTFGPTTVNPLQDTPNPSNLGYTPEDRRVVPFDAIPYQTDPETWGRGPQSGYNLCNSTTAGNNSQCQTLIVNSITDFCLFGNPFPDSIANQEAATVAYCINGTKWGTRTIPTGAITGVTWVNTPEYIQLSGTINQTGFDLLANDTGGELDPVGADYRGNPLGGLVYSSAFAENGTMEQIMHWTEFIGSGTFCLKICLPGSYNGTINCNHLYDELGYNAPGNYTEGVFEVCDGDQAMPVGLYYSDGLLETYTQPPTSIIITSIPYKPTTPPSSNCQPPTSTPTAFAIAGGSSAAASASTTAMRRLRMFRD